MDNNSKILKLTHYPDAATLVIKGLDEKLTVSLDTVITHRLVEGIVLTPSQLQVLLKEGELFRCDRTVSRMLANRGHSVGEIRVKLKRKEFSEEAIKTTIAAYLRKGYLDDTHYATSIGERFLRQKPCGRSFLVAYLQRKLIPRKIAEFVADSLLVHTDISQQAIEALRKRWSRYKDLELEDARTKAYNYLSRRGFTYEAAREAFTTVQQEND